MGDVSTETKQTWQVMAETFVAQAGEAGLFCVTVLLSHNFALIARSCETADFWEAMHTLFNAYEKAEKEGRCVQQVSHVKAPN